MSAPGCAGSCAGRPSATARRTRIGANHPEPPRPHCGSTVRGCPPAATEPVPSGRCGHRRHPEVAPRPKRRVRAKVLVPPRHMPGVICRVTEADSGDRFPPRIFVRTPTIVLPQTTERRGARDPERPSAARATTAGIRHRPRSVPPAPAIGSISGPPHPARSGRPAHTTRPGKRLNAPRAGPPPAGIVAAEPAGPPHPRHSRLTEARAGPRLTMQPPAATSAQSAQAGARPHIPVARAAGHERRSAGAGSGAPSAESSDARGLFARGTFRATDAFR